MLAFLWAPQSPAVQPYWNAESTEVRTRLAGGAVSVWKSRPILGIGPGQFLNQAGFGRQTHNTFLEMGAELGIVGFGALLVLAYLALVRSARRALYREHDTRIVRHAGVTAGVVAVSVMALTISLAGVKLMWVALAVAAISSKREA